MSLLAALVVSALSSLFVPLQQSQAQLLINVYPSQDNPTNQTLWIFSGSSTTRDSQYIRIGSTSFSRRDSWRFTNNNFFNANRADGQLLSLSPLFSSSNTDDIKSVAARIPSGGKINITFAASATNTPTLTIGSGNRTISQLFLDDNSGFADRMGIRVSGSSVFSYSSGNASAWVGAGILSKPIGDFSAGTHNNDGGSGVSPDFALLSSGSVRVVVNSQIIPEPQEYALVFGLFALGFVFFHRHRQKKLCQQSAAS